MIEKFSKEELKQIKKELGLYEKRIKLHNSDIHWKQAEEMMKEKPFCNRALSPDQGIFWHIAFLVACSMNYFSKRKYKTGKIGDWSPEQTIPIGDEEEYHEMFQEILDIMEKHNRKWENDYNSNA